MTNKYNIGDNITATYLGNFVYGNIEEVIPVGSSFHYVLRMEHQQCFYPFLDTVDSVVVFEEEIDQLKI